MKNYHTPAVNTSNQNTNTNTGGNYTARKRLWRSFCAFTLLFSLFLPFVFHTTALADYTVPSHIKVGLSFGSSAVSKFSGSVSGSLIIGRESNYEFAPDMLLGVSAVNVKKGGGAYLRSAQAFGDMPSAAAKSLEIQKSGLTSFAAYCDGGYYVAIGIFDNIQAAEAAAGVYCGLEFIPYTASLKALCISAGTYNFLYHSESESFAFTSDTEDGYVQIGSRKYRGHIVATRLYSSNIAVINLVSMTDYIASVIGGEIFPSWPIETLKAQAIVARTYMCTTSLYKEYGIDATNDARTQIYSGLQTEFPATLIAAQETDGIVVLYNGLPARTFFGTSNGGVSADLYSAWGSTADMGYLTRVEDPYEDTENIPGGVWSASFTAEELQTRLQNAGVDIGDVINMSVTVRGTDLRVRKLTFYGTKRDYSVTFERCRTILGLPSQYFYIQGDKEVELSPAPAVSTPAPAVSATPTPVPTPDPVEETPIPEITPTPTNPPTDNEQPANPVTLWGTYRVDVTPNSDLPKVTTVSFNRISYMLSLANGQLYSGNVAGNGIKLSAEFSADNSAPPTVFVINGRGSGHGLGMSQYGAKVMAERGLTFDQIISFYYPGTELSR